MQSKESIHNSNPIPYIRVEPNLSSATGFGNFIEWNLHPKFHRDGTHIFFVEKAFSLSGPWITVAQSIDQLFAFDQTEEVGYRGELDSYYRIRLKVMGGGEPEWYLSEPAASRGYWWSKRDYLLSKEILRRELVRMKRGSGNIGYLLKRKTFGEKCPRCIDKATGKATDSQCPVCFGTGYNGGYYGPVVLWVEFGEERIIKRVAETGMVSEVSTTARCPAFPDIQSNDVWMNKHTGQIYRIGAEVANVAKVRNVPIVKQFTFSLVPTSDILYSYGNPKDSETRVIEPAE